MGGDQPLLKLLQAYTIISQHACTKCTDDVAGVGVAWSCVGLSVRHGRELCKNG